MTWLAALALIAALFSMGAAVPAYAEGGSPVMAAQSDGGKECPCCPDDTRAAMTGCVMCCGLVARAERVSDDRMKPIALVDGARSETPAGWQAQPDDPPPRSAS